MMKKAFGVFLLLGLASVPALAQKVNIDYAHEFDFKSVKTFQYVDTEEGESANPLMADRIKSMIKQKLIAGGLTEVESNPDLFITDHVITEQKTSYNTTTFGYGGYGGGWYGWGGSMGVATTSVTPMTYVDGTLIIDAWEPKEKKMVWRGTSTVTVKSSPEKQIKQVESILDKLGKKWQKILAGKGK
jgi:hypothetical protein